MTNTPDKSIQHAVLEKIRSGSVKKLPHAYFMFRVVATLLVSVLLLIISSFVISFVLFSFYVSGQQFLLGFGLEGIIVFLKLFPWGLCILDIALLFLLEWLLQGFKFAYRIPLLNIFLGIVGASILIGVLINTTPLHTLLLQRADQNNLPILGGAYEHIFDPHEDQGVCHGIVTSVGTTSDPAEFVIQHNDVDHDQDDGIFIVTPVPDTMLPPVHIGDRVLVFGVLSQGHIQAHNVQILPALPPRQ